MSDDTYVPDILIVALISIVGMVAIAVASQQGGKKEGFASGYTQCLQDMKKGNPPAYVLVEQADGTTKWEQNKEQSK